MPGLLNATVSYYRRVTEHFSKLPQVWKQTYSNEDTLWPNGKHSVKRLRTSSDWHLYPFWFHLPLPVREPVQSWGGQGSGGPRRSPGVLPKHRLWQHINSGRHPSCTGLITLSDPAHSKDARGPPLPPQLEADLNGLTSMRNWDKCWLQLQR